MERYSLTKRVVLTGALLLGGITLAACADEGAGGTPSPQNSSNAQPHIEAEYYSSGARIVRYVDETGLYADILQVCDGDDLLEQTEFVKVGYGAGGAASDRSVNHPACDDGVLTREDF